MAHSAKEGSGPTTGGRIFWSCIKPNHTVGPLHFGQLGFWKTDWSKAVHVVSSWWEEKKMEPTREQFNTFLNQFPYVLPFLPRPLHIGDWFQYQRVSARPMSFIRRIKFCLRKSSPVTELGPLGFKVTWSRSSSCN